MSRIRLAVEIEEPKPGAPCIVTSSIFREGDLVREWEIPAATFDDAERIAARVLNGFRTAVLSR